MQIKAEAKFWEVRVSVASTTRPKKLAKKRVATRHHLSFTVIAESMEKVTELVIAKYPSAEFREIRLCDYKVDLIVQPELMS